MHQSLVVVTPSTCEPLTSSEAKAWLRLSSDDTTNDAIVDALNTAARKRIEQRTGRFFYQTTVDLRLDECPGSTGVIRIPSAPLVSVTSITSYNSTDGETVMSSSDYTVDTASEPGRIALRDAGSWPTDLRAIDGVAVRCVVGYSSSTSNGWTSSGQSQDVLPMLQAHRLLLAHLYENRQAVVVGKAAAIATEIPMGVEYLLAPLMSYEVEG